MSPDRRNLGHRAAVPSNLYTVLLALAFSVILATAAYVAYKSYSQYGSIFRTTQQPSFHYRSPKM